MTEEMFDVRPQFLEIVGSLLDAERRLHDHGPKYEEALLSLQAEARNCEILPHAVALQYLDDRDGQSEPPHWRTALDAVRVPLLRLPAARALTGTTSTGETARPFCLWHAQWSGPGTPHGPAGPECGGNIVMTATLPPWMTEPVTNQNTLGQTDPLEERIPGDGKLTDELTDVLESAAGPREAARRTLEWLDKQGFVPPIPSYEGGRLTDEQALISRGHARGWDDALHQLAESVSAMGTTGSTRRTPRSPRPGNRSAAPARASPPGSSRRTCTGSPDSATRTTPMS